MAITIDRIVKVTGTVVNAGFQQAALIVNALTENQLVPADDNRTLAFANSSTVGDYFGTTSDEYLFAKTYFAGYTGSLTKPKSILFSRYVQTATAAYSFSSTLAAANTVTAIKALTSPAFVAHINGATQTLTLLQSDFTAATGLTDIAAVIQTKLAAVLTGCTATIIGNNQFQVQAPTSSAATTTITYSTGNVSDLLKLSAAFTPVLSQGTAGGDAAFNMGKIINGNSNWIALTYVTRLSGDTLGAGYPVTVDLTSWISGQDSNYIGLWWEGGTQPLNPASTTNLSAILIAAGYGSRTPNSSAGQVTFSVPIQIDYNGNGIAFNSVTSHYVGQYSAFVGGIGASINYGLVNGKINFAGKRQAGLITNVANTTDYDNLLLQGFNVYGSFSTRASNYQFNENGAIGGVYMWIDNIYDSVWFIDQEQNQLATLIQNSGRIPYNDSGKAQVTAVLTNVVQAAITNGVIEVGNTFDEEQVQEVIELVGADITPLLTANGYFIYYPPITAVQRSQRQPLQVYLLYTNGGAINQISVGQVFVS